MVSAECEKAQESLGTIKDTLANTLGVINVHTKLVGAPTMKILQEFDDAVKLLHVPVPFALALERALGQALILAKDYENLDAPKQAHDVLDQARTLGGFSEELWQKAAERLFNRH